MYLILKATDQMDSTMRCKWFNLINILQNSLNLSFSFSVCHFFLLDLHFLLHVFSIDYLGMSLPHLFSHFTLNLPNFILLSLPSSYFYIPVKPIFLFFFFLCPLSKKVSFSPLATLSTKTTSS